ncbi:MAG: lytic transglycosylase domain-containing protein [Proteobacteria bacterium]|nr:lytic transglycosylase domain-containing protein [Pseudomonadota bacterium]
MSTPKTSALIYAPLLAFVGGSAAAQPTRASAIAGTDTTDRVQAPAAARRKQETAPVVESLREAMLKRIAIGYSHRSKRSVPAFHCRKAREGCRERLGHFARYIALSAARYKIDAWILAAVALHESGFNPFAVGARGEMGIFQIHPKSPWGRRLRFVRDGRYRERCRMEPGACQREVVFRAAELLAWATATCEGDLQFALGAYNTGRCGGSDAYGRRIFRERRKLRRAAGLERQPVAKGIKPGRWRIRGRYLKDPANAETLARRGRTP